MSYAIIWTPEALATFGDRIAYLNIHWTEKEVLNFKRRVKAYLDVLQESPLITQKPGKLKNVHIGVVIKQVSLIYRVKHSTNEIELIAFIDNRQNPKKIKRYKS